MFSKVWLKLLIILFKWEIKTEVCFAPLLTIKTVKIVVRKLRFPVDSDSFTTPSFSFRRKWLLICIKWQIYVNLFWKNYNNQAEKSHISGFRDNSTFNSLSLAIFTPKVELRCFLTLGSIKIPKKYIFGDRPAGGCSG